MRVSGESKGGIRKTNSQKNSFFRVLEFLYLLGIASDQTNVNFGWFLVIPSNICVFLILSSRTKLILRFTRNDIPLVFYADLFKYFLGNNITGLK